eukprot:4890338-Prymnesium_polylepis.1
MAPSRTAERQKRGSAGVGTGRRPPRGPRFLPAVSPNSLLGVPPVRHKHNAYSCKGGKRPGTPSPSAKQRR